MNQRFIPTTRIAEGRSLNRAVTASVLATIQKTLATRVLQRAWPRDDYAAAILKSAQSPTTTADFPAHDQIAAFRSIAPGSAALKLFDISVKLDLAGITHVRIPNVSGQIRPPFVAEGKR